MKILVANLGSTSFKYRLFDLPETAGREGGVELARGGIERIGAVESRVYATAGTAVLETLMPVPDHAVALEAALAQLGPEVSPEEAANILALAQRAIVARGTLGFVGKVLRDADRALGHEILVVAKPRRPVDR